MHENTNRCNGHIQVSPIGRTQKRDRKGCKKGKIEMIMKNSMGATKSPKPVPLDSVFKRKAKLFSSSNHHHMINSGSVIKNEIIDDPYTFTDSEPQSVGLYSASNCLSLARKVQTVPGVGALPASGGSAPSVQPKADCVPSAGKMMRAVGTSADLSACSKTMNQLQADIARNRVIVKRRKVVPPHQQPSSQLNESSPARTFARVSLPAKRLPRQTTWQRERRTRHEALQRIQEAQQQVSDEKRDLFPLGLELSDSENDSDSDEEASSGVYQRHWFMGWEGRGERESRLSQVRGELRRRLRQAWHGIEASGQLPSPSLVQALIAAARTHPTATALLLDPRLLANYSKQSRAKVSMLGVKQCSLCQRRALPCTRHCSDHIMYNVDQLLFAYCTAKLSDNTQCRVPVFDVIHQLPLCPQHARSQINITKVQPDTTPKRSRKKTKPSTLNRSRSKKKKKPRPSSSTQVGGGGGTVSIATTKGGEPSATTTPATIRTVQSSTATTSATTSASATATATARAPRNEIAGVFQAEVQTDVPQVEIEVQLDGVEEVPEEVLAIASMDPAELASQASKLLEDHDFTNMLLPPDAFNDLFTEDKNGEYEPTKEETEELERALEAVDKDVRSLERTLTRSNMTLPLALPLETITLLDEVPNVYTYSNGFTSVQTDLRNS